jgi:hypothetical protein
VNGTLWFVAEVLIYGALWCYLLGLVPALVVTALKDNWLLLLVGVVTLGLVWFIGAAGEANAGSWWARRFYPSESDSDSRHIRDFHLRRRRKALTIAVAALVLVGAFAARPTVLLGTDPGSLQHSVGGGLMPFEKQCQPRPSGDWTCYIFDSGLSGDMPYLTEVDWAGCWTARSLHSGRLAPRVMTRSGCVTMFDHFRPLSRILD